MYLTLHPMAIEKNPAFLKAFIQEELYLVSEHPHAGTSKSPGNRQETQDAEQPAPETAAAIVKESAGELVILLKNNFDAMEASQKLLLQKITSAIKIDLAATTLLSEAEYKNAPAVVEGYRRVLSFGVELPQATARYQISKRGEQQFLVSDSLAALEQAIALKGKLWSAMQLMFSA